MSIAGFIAGRLKFKGRLALASTALSFLVMIISVAVSSGFRNEIRSAVAELSGDISVDSDRPLELPDIEGVESVSPVIFQIGIVKNGEIIQGVMFKASESRDSLHLGVIIPERLSKLLGIAEGDNMLTYFVGEERVKARKFLVKGIYSSPVEADGNLVVLSSMEDMRRVMDIGEGECTSVEIKLGAGYRTDYALRSKTAEVGAYVYPLHAESSVDRFPQLFDWLSLIDFNVLAIIALMTVVAGFNMISGLLILLFRSISTIGTLKALGMPDKTIAGVFLRVGARITGLGMLAGNVLAFCFCLIQGKTHFLKLNPENYFVSYVPVNIDWGMVLLCDLAAFAAILLLLMIPTLFISRVDPARTIKAD